MPKFLEGRHEMSHRPFPEGKLSQFLAEIKGILKIRLHLGGRYG
jgi:hypothetical protein